MAAVTSQKTSQYPVDHLRPRSCPDCSGTGQMHLQQIRYSCLRQGTKRYEVVEFPPGTTTLSQGLQGCDASTLASSCSRCILVADATHHINQTDSNPHWEHSLSLRVLASTQRKQHTFCPRSCTMPLCWNACRTALSMALRAYADGQINPRWDNGY